MTETQPRRHTGAAADVSVDPTSTEAASIDAPFVATYLVKRKPGMSFEAFADRQLRVHAPLVRALPGLIDHRLLFFPPRGDVPNPLDAIAQVSFESEAAYQRAMASPEGERALADLPNMLDMTAIEVKTSDSHDLHVTRGSEA